MEFKDLGNSFRLNSKLTCSYLMVISLILSSILMLSPSVEAASPKLSSYFQEVPWQIVDSSYTPRMIAWDATVDINSDGHQDFIVLGHQFPKNGITTYSPQPSRVLLGDGEGGFVIAPSDLFPVETLNTVHPRKVLFADFNGDGLPDMFVACHGWDADPFPGEQNRLFLSQKKGGWEDATSNLPQLNDFSHSAAVGDINGDGKIDIFVANVGGESKILPYTLLNDGTGHFRLTSSNIPVGSGQMLDINTDHVSAGATLVDLDNDHLPELIVTAEAVDSYSKLTHTTILWNKGGIFSEDHKSKISPPDAFPSRHIDLDIQAIDINGDGLLDLVLAGTQGMPAFYDGWFVQILVNKGNHKFVDETTSRLAAEDIFGGTIGVATGTLWPIWVKVLDFNHDGFPDFTVEFRPTTRKQDQAILWINDGKGQFATLKIGDFVVPGKEWLLGMSNHLTQTKKGFSFFQIYSDNRGLTLAGLLARRPYGIPPVMTPINMLLIK